ncbi:glycoside hydrolase family 3 protein [Allonocardiopsis opalescens]|uniref:Exo-1,4-beta-glucosidase n=1 Tax=Allonocardiopsis opalescens TaxID=1144618 RepID=A0A2T0PX24_9ACTN|nr:glycoside hydrolase family 3 protein [Allonocardiopsis opalescens]PRX96087.1 exo-1,4-beta-glucosidase [Allonocardiopsis opalescens]
MTEPVTGTYRDPELPVADRVEDLLRRLTPDERIGLLHQHQAPVERLGLGAFRTGTEALHGLAWLGPATVFPQAVGLGSTWDPALVRAVGAATAEEVLAYHRKDPAAAGRNVWAPVVNPLRDPRWGRNEEGYAEDPWLTGLLGAAYARGLAGPGPRLRTAPTLKHFLAYNNETDRCTTSSNLPPRVLHEYELPAFLPALRAGAAVAVMPSYNLVNGRPAHLSPLIAEVLRAAAPDDILVVSDAFAPGNLTALQGFHPDPPTAYAHAIKAGLDSFTQDADRPEATLGHIREALRRGLLAPGDIDAAARHALSIRFRLGEFDPEDADGSRAQDGDVVNSPAHQALARTAATRSIVLLKNDGLLPLARPRRVAVIGQLGDALMEDWYSGTLPYSVTARDGIAARVETVFHEGVDRVVLRTGSGRVTADADPAGGPLRVVAGADRDSCAFDVFDWGGGAKALRAAANGRYLSAGEDGVLVNDQPGPAGWEVRQTFRFQERPGGAVVLRHIATGQYVTAAPGGTLVLTGDADAAAVLTVETLTDGARAAAALAATAEVAVVVAGDHPLVNGRETEDRADLDLPAAQERVLRAVHAANPKTVLVLSSGYPFSATWADETLPAVVWSAHGGQEYGNALADVLFGDAEPAGRLTQTWYRSAAELPDLFDYDIIASDATYLYYRGNPLYPFGHGLSYTDFDYSGLQVAVVGGRVLARAVVTNTGDRPGSEVVQCYTQQRRSRVKQPLRQLRGFARVELAPGESRTVTIAFDLADLAVWDVTRNRFVVEDAPRKIQLGRSAKDIRLRAPLDVPGETIPPRSIGAGPWSAADHDDYHGVTPCPAAPERGEAVRSAEADSWIAFRDVAFPPAGSGPAAVRVSANAASGGTLSLRLDDPLDGPLVGALALPPEPDRFAFAEYGCPLGEAATGRRDLFVVFDQPGVAVAILEAVPSG